ncbi:hypothetical protein KNP414_01136 [Paenibacillus mucilaginosus KNP414]|uniref:Uncharacterized protein n=2 Tax=Paenibacillus mucilaginosus TaxID=61624 RepID=F8FF03_PAEMK|nr:hypothetical protein KNP414_01136 [Paenibacillus mucilaginosus KNP414]
MYEKGRLRSGSEDMGVVGALAAFLSGPDRETEGRDLEASGDIETLWEDQSTSRHYRKN